nr:uncharacterized protein LOC117218916 [Megalopta genalis]
MKKISNSSELLEKLMNISKECSDIESNAINSELSSEDETVHIQSQTSETEDSDEESIINDENESVINMLRKRCRVLSSSDSDEETENTFQETETAADGTVWSKFDEGGIPGLPSTCIFKGVKGPTGYAKRNIIADNLISAFSLIIDNHIIKHIKKCKEEEGSRILRNDWTSLPEIRAFIGILYARGAYEAKNLKLSYL